MANNLMLYWGSGSVPCWRVMLVLAEKGLQYKERIVSFDKNEHKCEEIMRLNPRGQVPTFKHGDIVINESMATCHYLESTFKGQGTVLIPEDAKERALVLQRTFESQNVFDSCIRDFIYYIWLTKDKPEAELKKREDKCRTELQAWEGYLEKMGDKSFVAGKNFSMADCLFFPSIAFMVRLGLDLNRYPRLAAYYNMATEHPSIKQTWPPHWKGTEGEVMLKSI